jgi:hypothetical protein
MARAKAVWRWAAVGQTLLACLFCSHAQAAMVVDISYDFVETEISPRQEIHRQQLHEHFELNSDKTVTMPKGSSKLGGTFMAKEKTGHDIANEFHIVNGAFQITSLHEGAILIITIRANDRDSCSASLVWRKRAGQKYFFGYRINNNDLMYDSDMHAENITCSVHEQ